MALHLVLLLGRLQELQQVQVGQTVLDHYKYLAQTLSLSSCVNQVILRRNPRLP